MDSGTKQKFKQFSINSIQDACLVMGMLISGLMVHLEKYKEYANEAQNLLEASNSEYILAKDYDNINDKLLYRQHEILKLTADHQSSSFSYKDIRKRLEKKGYLAAPLSQEIALILNELLDVRNWSFHNPQSLMTAAKEIAGKNVPNGLKDIVRVDPQLNPIIVLKVEKYELLMLASLTIHTEKRIKQFETILKNMQADYQEMYNSIESKTFLMTAHGLSSEVQYVDRWITAQLTGYQSDIAQISMAIQKSKYDGSEQVFNDWVARFGKGIVKYLDEEANSDPKG